MNRKSGLRILAAMIVAGAGLTVVAASASAGPARGPGAPISRAPRIVARPGSVMVNTKTELSGSGFLPHRRLTIWECSARGWIVPRRVCNHRNALRVRTNGSGRFKASLVALVCPLAMHVMATVAARGDVPVEPAASRFAAGFARTCYVGVPTIRGVDTVTLAGAARITVTGP